MGGGQPPSLGCLDSVGFEPLRQAAHPLCSPTTRPDSSLMTNRCCSVGDHSGTKPSYPVELIPVSLSPLTTGPSRRVDATDAEANTLPLPHHSSLQFISQGNQAESILQSYWEAKSTPYFQQSYHSLSTRSKQLESSTSKRSHQAVVYDVKLPYKRENIFVRTTGTGRLLPMDHQEEAEEAEEGEDGS